MKILQVITSLHTGGAEKLIVDIAPLLRSHGHDVDSPLEIIRNITKGKLST